MSQSPLARIGVFAKLPADALLRLERSATVFEPRSGTELFAEGDPADAVYAIVGGEGRVQTGVSDRSSKRLIIDVFSVGDIFGEMGVIDADPRSAGAVTDGRVRLMRIGAATFNAVLNDTPQLGANLSRLLSHRLRRTFVLFQDATFERLEVLLARQILYLAEQHGRRTGQGVLLVGRLRQHDLANLIGATTRSIITILNGWRTGGFVHYDTEKAQLTVIRPERLHKLIEDED
jgi:CRP/FNR family transcriptional regulator, cyclic AMP receptor protein